MSEQNDFFDELIDDEISMDDYEVDDDDDDEDDDFSPVTIRSVLMAKDGMLALLSLKTNEESGVIVRIDPRQASPAAQKYDDAEAAGKWFNRSLMTSKRNGWAVMYDGEPLFG